jgi:hypothetical protein
LLPIYITRKGNLQKEKKNLFRNSCLIVIFYFLFVPMGATPSRPTEEYDIVFDASEIDDVLTGRGWPVHVAPLLLSRLQYELSSLKLESISDEEMQKLIRKV